MNMKKNRSFIPNYTIHDVGDIQTLSQIYPQNIRDLNVPKIWTKTRGKGVVVAILDTGCPLNHPDLKSNVDVSKCVSFIPNEDIYDTVVGHSTHCSGTIGASDNAEGIVGIAPEVTIITLKVLDNNGRNYKNSIEQGLAHCLKIKPDVISMSLGGGSPMPEAHALIKQLVELGIPIICSAGNNGTNNVLFPAQYDECIAVGSYTDSVLKNRSEFSSWGDSLDIMAPGEKILSTYLNGQYAVLSGTSMAAPVISGVVALMISYYKSFNRTLKVSEIKKMLYDNAVDTGPKGKDLENGWGVINPDNLFVATSIDKTVVKNDKLTFVQKIKKLFFKVFK